MNPIVDALAQRVRSAGSDPLVTWYQPAAGVRTELSVRTFANWVDKTANLIDDLGVTGRIAGVLNRDHPGHWMALVWPLAAWQQGCEYAVGQLGTETELVVQGPDSPIAHPGASTIACSLHPLGLALPGLPAGVLDFSSEALAQPDIHQAAPVTPAGPAWSDAEQVISHAGLTAVPPQPGRVLVRPSTAWATLAEAILGPVLGGGSAVLVSGTVGDEELHRITAAERVTSPVA